MPALATPHVFTNTNAVRAVAPSTADLRETAVRAVLVEIASAARRHNGAAVADLGATLRTLEGGN